MNGRLVLPEVYLVGYTSIDRGGLDDYLRASGNEDFSSSFAEAVAAGVHSGEILCSFYAKLCYAALTAGKNDNLTRTRSVADNVRSCFDQAHGSVFEHASVNFVARNVSRVFTHELVRHRAGTAFSQTSGRYVRTDRLDVVADPILQEYGILTGDEQAEVHVFLEGIMAKMGQRISLLGGDFALKKKLTSAARRWLPNGQANEIGFTMNLRAVRHVVQMRTAAGAEREIRIVFGEVYRILKAKFPLLFHGAAEREVDGLLEVSEMKCQPYDRGPK